MEFFMWILWIRVNGEAPAFVVRPAGSLFGKECG